MKNNKIVIYAGLLLLGVLLGWLLFGGSSTTEAEHNHTADTEVNQMWTCSMHPQIMQPEAGDCPICGMDLIPAETTADGLLADQFKLTANAMALANIQTSIVGTGQSEGNTVKLSGKIVANEEANAVQVSYFAGRIERLNVSFVGEEVRKGQLLATIYSPELFAAQQELITAASLKESQPELYTAVRNKLKLWKLTESQIQKIETSAKVTENFPVYATVSGTVSEKLVEEGSAINQGQALLKIANLASVWANFDVYEHQIDLFKKGQEVAITTNTNQNVVYKGQVDFIDPVLDTKTRTVKLRVILDNKNKAFKPGMFVEGKITAASGASNEVLSIPASAILWTGKRSVVYVQPDPKETVFEMREITLGRKIGANYQVLEGLEDGDKIVTNGTFTVDAAAQLQGKKSMMNPSGGTTMTGHEGHIGMGDASASADKPIVVKRVEVAKAFQSQLNAVFTDYIKVKDALVKDDSQMVVAEAKRLLEKVTKVDMKLLTDEAIHIKWMALEKGIKSAVVAMTKTEDLKAQRNYFKQLSSSLTSAIELFGVNEKVYHQYCPMADANKGAYWLSKEEIVSNPYFGAAMLKCGEVTQVIE